MLKLLDKVAASALSETQQQGQTSIGNWKDEENDEGRTRNVIVTW
jgi:hypothetical protein